MARSGRSLIPRAPGEVRPSIDGRRGGPSSQGDAGPDRAPLILRADASKRRTSRRGSAKGKYAKSIGDSARGRRMGNLVTQQPGKLPLERACEFKSRRRRHYSLRFTCRGCAGEQGFFHMGQIHGPRKSTCNKEKKNHDTSRPPCQGPKRLAAQGRPGESRRRVRELSLISALYPVTRGGAFGDVLAPSRATI